MSRYERKSTAERWRAGAQQAGMNHDAERLGSWLIDVMETDSRNGDKRLYQLLGLDFFARMMKFGLNKPKTAARVWRHMIERRQLPPR